MNLKTILQCLLLMICAAMITSCTDTEECCEVIDVAVNIHYKNSQGQNLINSVDSLDESKIRIYYKNGENYDYINHSNLDAPNMHSVYENSEGELILKVFASYYYEGNFSTTLIELDPNIVDTLVCEFQLTDNLEIVTNAWLNGVESKNAFFEVVK